MKWLAAFTLFFLVVTGCSNAGKAVQGNESKELSQRQTVSKSYLENKGYRIVSYEGNDSYELTKQKIVTMPYMLNWGMQSLDPSEYFGKTINVEKYVVTHHPLAPGEVDVYVYEVDGQPIGGTSFPHGDTSDGGGWSLDGKTLEELQSKSYKEWSEEWINRFSD